MIEIAKKTLDYYFRHFLEPEPAHIGINEDPSPKNGSTFVTIYSGGNVRGSAGNIKAIEKDIRIETMRNTYSALTQDSRFQKVSSTEKDKIKLRVDTLIEHKNIKIDEFEQIDPAKNGVIVIHKDRSSLAVILPNISSKLVTGKDFGPALAKKLGIKEFNPENYILYKITTNMETDF